MQSHKKTKSKIYTYNFIKVLFHIFLIKLSATNLNLKFHWHSYKKYSCQVSLYEIVQKAINETLCMLIHYPGIFPTTLDTLYFTRLKGKLYFLKGYTFHFFLSYISLLYNETIILSKLQCWESDNSITHIFSLWNKNYLKHWNWINLTNF